MKRLVHLEDYKSVLPYASEIFGVYQPLFGWRGQRSIRRLTEGFGERRDQPVGRLVPESQAELVWRALQDDWDDETFAAELAAQTQRRCSSLAR